MPSPNMRTSLLSALCLVLPATVTALDMLVELNTINCENLPVKVSIAEACGSDGLCTLGESQYLEGSFVYDGLEQYNNVTNEDTFVMDIKLGLRLLGVKVFEQVLMDSAVIPVCGLFEANENNENGECPADGLYDFASNYTIPAPDSTFLNWAASGYNGEIELDVFAGDNLVGRCVVEARTMSTGSVKKGAFETTPSGRIAMIAVLAFSSLCILCVCWRMVSCCCCSKKKDRASPSPLETHSAKDVHQDEPTTEFTRMEAGGPNYEEDYGGEVNSRYAAPGPVI